MSFNPNDLIGVTLNRKYKIKRVIGKGGMGFVYLAQQTFPSRQVAIKVLRPKELIGVSYAELLERFKREAQIIAEFRHRHIIHILDYGEHDRLPYLVMPYINEGRTLRNLLKQKGFFSFHEALYYVQQITDALDYAHNQDVVHRDIKPNNFLLDTDGQLILADFGIARTPNSILTQPGIQLGTIDYMAPELKDPDVEPNNIDYRADIYSLGVVLCEMVTGCTPSRLSHRRPPQTMLSAVDVVIQKATAPERENRYQSAGELAEALRVAIEREANAPTIPKAGEIPRLIPVQRNATPTSSRKFLLIGGIVFVTLLLIGGIIWTLQVTGIINYLLHPPTITAQQADATVLHYYEDWNKRDYQAAYGLLDPVWQNMNGNSFTEQHRYYEQTHYSCVTINSTTQSSDGTFQVAITDNAIEDNSPGRPGIVIRVYKGYYMVIQEQGSLRLYPHLQLVSTKQYSPVYSPC